MPQETLISADVLDKAGKVLNDNKVAIFIVAYNAENHIEKVLNRIPKFVSNKIEELYIIDDHSSDATVQMAHCADWPQEFAPIKIFKTPYNLGYGGNQCLGYQYAIKREFDIVVLLHGDGQYAPEFLPYILAGYSEGVDAVFGTRFSELYDPKSGGMPSYKYYGNRVLTSIQNALLKTTMHEMHSGYRSYRTKALSKVPFEYNAKWFDFDADIIVQFKAAGLLIKEVPIPTYYGDEICHVNGIKYAWKCVLSAVHYRLMQYEIFYHPKFDIRVEKSRYISKKSKNSIHAFMKKVNLPMESHLLDVGCGESQVAAFHAKRGVKATVIDQFEGEVDKNLIFHKVDLDNTWADQFAVGSYENVFAMDILEHLKSPEEGLREMHKCLRQNGSLYISTGNVAFFPIRLMLLLGFFNYGRRGVLDLTHKRLYTIGSFQRQLRNAGFRIEKTLSFGVPLTDLVDDGFVSRLIERCSSLLAKVFPSLFAYQMLCVCTKLDTDEDLMKSLLMPLRKGTSS